MSSTPEQAREWRARNKDRIKAYMLATRAHRARYARKRRKLEPEHIRDINRRYRARHREAQIARGRAWRLANPERQRARMKAFVAANPSYHRQWQKNNRLRKALHKFATVLAANRERA